MTRGGPSGIRIGVHPLFLPLALASVLTGYWVELATLFGLVLVHELGHFAAARGFGWKVEEIRLFPFGGVMVTDAAAGAPFRQEAAVALAGPLQHVWMIGLAYCWRQWGWVSPEWCEFFVRANATLALFNLLPVSPLDGGRLVWAAVGAFTPFYRTIRRCAVFGAVVGAGLTAAALFGPWGVRVHAAMMGAFLFVENWKNYRSSIYRFWRFLAQRTEASVAFSRNGVPIAAFAVDGRRTVRETVKLFVKNKFHIIYVLDEKGITRRVFPEDRLIEELFSSKRPDRPLRDLPPKI
ncbi:MAG: hypothetical protein BLM47_08210 [Candidatus Reconcilbacillus cellulovorans]|uniref:Peptidase M50 domain-containing protein n=1 Tax=Candidatus Reconcilbacillus cellulovorans TaxID=1906605 RepID=A0A2A6E0E6_9BACL|nr:MAG: hypothetical protein BLM47_08210 [Candidatus Reconcilbacillus cellulovorans]